MAEPTAGALVVQAGVGAPRHGSHQRRARAGRPAPVPEAPTLRAEAARFFGLAGAMVISRLGLAAMAIADGLMLARHSVEQFAVHGLAEQIFGRAFDISIAFMVAGVALVAQARSGSRSQRAQIGRVWKQALWLACAAGAAGLLLGLFGAEVLGALGQGSELAGPAGRVMLILSLGMLPALLAMASAGVLEALGHSLVVAWLVVVANVLNVIFNAMLIDGIAGGPPLGAQGVAWSTTGVRVLLAAALLAYLWWLPKRDKYGLRTPFTRDDWRAGAEQRARGWNAAATVSVLAGLSLGLPVMAGWLGAAAVAELTAVFLVLAPCMVVSWGLADAAGLRVAAVLGRKADARLRQVGWRCTALTGGVLLLLGGAYVAVLEPALQLMLHDDALVQRVLPMMPLALVLILVDGLSFVIGANLRSLGQLRWPFVLQAACALLMLPLAWWLAFEQGWGVRGLLAGLLGAGALRLVGLAVLYQLSAGRMDGERSDV